LAAQKTTFILKYYKEYTKNRNILKIAYSIEKAAYKSKNVEEKGSNLYEEAVYYQITWRFLS
jgi:hypothetical protein